MPPPLPFPLFRICISDCRRYFPSNGTLHASPTTPHPPSASCLTKGGFENGSVFLELTSRSGINVSSRTSKNVLNSNFEEIISERLRFRARDGGRVDRNDRSEEKEGCKCSYRKN